MKRRRRAIEPAGVSFLDCICCGFGAVVLLLVVVKLHDPVLDQQHRENLIAESARQEERLAAVEVETRALEAELAEVRDQAGEHRQAARALEDELSTARSALEDQASESEVLDSIREAARRAEQQLVTEIERRRRYRRSARDRTVGGIPADSEYIIFVIDTSGSMRNYNWARVIQKVSETLKVYPKVEGIQILNDMGNYMFSSYAGRWIPDSAQIRRRIQTEMVGWDAFSNSSPVEGIEKAIRKFHAWDKKISIYVFGDEFTGSSFQEVIERVARINRPDARNEQRVRIHAVGFSINTTDQRFLLTNRRFATLMSALCARNGGTFVGL